MMNKVFAMFASGDFTVVRDFVASYGAYAAYHVIFTDDLSVHCSTASGIFAHIRKCESVWMVAGSNPYPGQVLWQERLYVSTLQEFWDVMWQRNLQARAGLAQIDTFFERYGKNTILICRLLPFISFDIVSYAAGLTSMSFMSFFIATGIGQLPATIVYSYVGGMLTGGAKLFVTALMILFALSALIFMLRKIYMDRQSKKEKGRI